MTLLEEIQSAAVDGSCDVTTLLRKSKLLGARLGSESLEEWVSWELNGYPAQQPVPEYRQWGLELKGHFVGSFGRQLSNVPIPVACLPEEAQKHYHNYSCRQSVASIEDTIARTKAGTVTISTSDLALLLSGKVYDDMTCIQCWAFFGVGALVNVLNSVRNRVLEFAIAVWKEAPNIGEKAGTARNSIEGERVTQIFNTVVYGGAANVVGSADGASIVITNLANDWTSLKAMLEKGNVATVDAGDLKVALDQEPRPQPGGKFGPKVSGWIAKMMQKAANGTWQIGLGAAGNLLSTAIEKYYGMR